MSTTTPELIGTPIHTSNGHLLAVGNTVLASTIRLQAFDTLTLDNEGDPVRLSDTRLTVDQALALIGDLTKAVANAHANELFALRSIINRQSRVID